MLNKAVSLVRAGYIIGGRFLNKLIRPLGIKVEGCPKQKRWDAWFAGFIEQAKRTGEDPNDILNKKDGKWKNNEELFFSTYLQPQLKPGMVILEVGPGLGRYTRRVLSFSREIYLIDYSEYCCAFLQEYLQGHQGVRIIHTAGKEDLPIPNNSVDLAFSISTFVHLYLEEIYWYLNQFHRVLKKGGRALINYDSMMDSDGYDFFKAGLPSHPFEERSLFRFYHPQQLDKIATSLGFRVEQNRTHEHQRGYSFLTLVKV